MKNWSKASKNTDRKLIILTDEAVVTYFRIGLVKQKKNGNEWILPLISYLKECCFD